MSARQVTITQKELTGLAKAMQEAGVREWTADFEKPDGTRIRITAGQVATPELRPSIDKMLARANV